MGRTAKKTKKKDEKRKYVIQTNTRRHLYLLKYPISKLSQKRLPTVGCVLQYLQFVKSPLSIKFKSVKDVAGCPQKKGHRDLVCQENESCDGEYNCVVGEVTRIYRKAGYCDFLIGGCAIKDKIVKLHSRHTDLRRMSGLNWGKSSVLNSKEEEFMKDCSELFDICKKDTESLIAKDRMRDENAKKEDIEFLKDQRSERKMVIAEDRDAEYEQRVVKKHERAEKLKALEEKEQSSHLQADPHFVEESKLLHSELEISLEDNTEKDDSPGISPKEPHTSSNKSGKIIIELTADELIECTSAVSSRFNVGIRPQTAILSSILNKVIL